MAYFVISVTRDGDTLVTDSTAVIMADSMDVVEWIFQDLGEGETPEIEFTDSSTGPLQALATKDNKIIGFGNKGTTETFSYLARILRPEESPLISEVLTLTNSSGEINPSPFATVTVSEGQVHVQPERLQVALFANATWTLADTEALLTLGLPSGTFAEINPPSASGAVVQGLDLQAQEEVHYTVSVTPGPLGPIDPVIEPLGWPPPTGGKRSPKP